MPSDPAQAIAVRHGGDADIGSVAALIGERARARVLMALLDGRALPASVLASEAGVAASTASEHLARLVDAGLLTVHRQGRARYFRLAGPPVAEALEALARIAAPKPIRSLRQGTRAHALRRARTCYNHLAGRLGLAIMSAMLDRGLLAGGDGRYRPGLAVADRLSAPGADLTYQLTADGRETLSTLGIDLAAVDRSKVMIRYCVDWSEQRHHLAGALGAALTRRLFDLDWIRHINQRRAVVLTDAGRQGLSQTFGLPANWD
ncbi:MULTISPECIES: helix-turn-helix domain-containing protein [Mycobacterium]|uniref:Transcriptional regulator n=1 Tax=Mycobacterium colombiense TaxID=339268 RepID=A0A329M9P8_9MYCO|nr:MULTISPECIES: helix-turn-helix domain-containing protein [Mycobacterium]MDM4139336.1 helix-turn-helix domain-containing protein [Mycobacterium sp. FLAC0960]RAV16634.1 transcriptional regulator [Mycobacterium colombiense]